MLNMKYLERVIDKLSKKIVMDAWVEDPKSFITVHGNAVPVEEGQTNEEAGKAWVKEKESKFASSSKPKSLQDRFEAVGSEEDILRVKKLTRFIESLEEEVKTSKNKFLQQANQEEIDRQRKKIERIMTQSIDESEGNFHIEGERAHPLISAETSEPVYEHAREREILSNGELREFGKNIVGNGRDNITKNSMEHFESLPTDQQQALRAYTSQMGPGGASEINSYLYKGKIENEKTAERAEAIRSALDTPIGEPAVLRRGVGDLVGISSNKKMTTLLNKIKRGDFSAAEQLKNGLVGTEVTNKGFTSTSHGPLSGYSDLPVQIIFKAPASTKGMDITSISEYGGGRSKDMEVLGALMGKSVVHENEVLLQAGLRYKIDDVKFQYKPTAKKRGGQIFIVASILSD